MIHPENVIYFDNETYIVKVYTGIILYNGDYVNFYIPKIEVIFKE
jgi:hypothetical protein